MKSQHAIITAHGERATESANQHPATPSGLSPLWTAKQAADYLGVHPRTVIRLAATGVIPAVRLGRCWRFVPEEMHRWAKEQSSKPQLSPSPPQEEGRKN